MTSDRSAAAAGLLPGDDLHRALLRSIVDAACAIFGARAASIFLLDHDADELVFEAVSGEGEALVGQRFPSSTGIAGWVLLTGQSLILDDVANDPRFASDIAAATGYFPGAIMAAPLQSGEQAVGVLEVLDRASGERFSVEQSRLLEIFAVQAAIALDLLTRSRTARTLLDDGSDEAAIISRLSARLDQADEDRRAAGYQLLDALERLLSSSR